MVEQEDDQGLSNFGKAVTMAVKDKKDLWKKLEEFEYFSEKQKKINEANKEKWHLGR